MQLRDKFASAASCFVDPEVQCLLAHVEVQIVRLAPFDIHRHGDLCLGLEKVVPDEAAASGSKSVREAVAVMVG